MRETLHKIDTKALKSMLSDILKRATLINSAMIPLYNHVLMALPAPEGPSPSLQRNSLLPLDLHS
jgi:hypothetical protein